MNGRNAEDMKKENSFQNPDTTGERVWKILCGVLIVALTVVTLVWMGQRCFRKDEMYTIAFIHSGNSLGEMLRVFTTDEVTNPPLFNIFMYFWYRIFPHSEWWMLLPVFLFFLTGLLVLARLVYKETGSYGAVFALICAGWINPFTFSRLIFYFRSYSMLFMLASITLYLFLDLQQNETFKKRVVYGFVLIALCFTHYFGAITMAAYGLADLFMAVRRKKKLFWMVPYIMVCVTLAPWLGYCMLHANKSLGDYWGMDPTLLRNITTVAELMGNTLVMGLFVIFACVYVFCLFWQKRQGKKIALLTPGICVWISFFTFFSVTLYSGYIHPEGGIFVPYYFNAVKPHLLVMFALGCAVTMKCIPWKALRSIVPVAVLAAAVLGGVKLFQKHVFVTPTTRNMREYIAADIARDGAEGKALYIYKDGDNQWDVPVYPAQGLREMYMNGELEDVEILQDAGRLKEFDRIYVWYDMFTYGGDEEKFSEVMEGFRLAEKPEGTGMWVYERNP